MATKSPVCNPVINKPTYCISMVMRPNKIPAVKATAEKVKHHHQFKTDCETINFANTNMRFRTAALDALANISDTLLRIRK